MAEGDFVVGIFFVSEQCELNWLISLYDWDFFSMAKGIDLIETKCTTPCGRVVAFFFLASLGCCRNIYAGR